MSDTKIQAGVGSLAVRVRGDRPAAVLWHSLFIDQAAQLLSGTMDVVERTEHLLAIVLPGTSINDACRFSTRLGANGWVAGDQPQRKPKMSTTPGGDSSPGPSHRRTRMSRTTSRSTISIRSQTTIGMLFRSSIRRSELRSSPMHRAR